MHYKLIKSLKLFTRPNIKKRRRTKQNMRHSQT